MVRRWNGVGVRRSETLDDLALALAPSGGGGISLRQLQHAQVGLGQLTGEPSWTSRPRPFTVLFAASREQEEEQVLGKSRARPEQQPWDLNKAVEHEEHEELSLTAAGCPTGCYPDPESR
jgi:hypothetical protein